MTVATEDKMVKGDIGTLIELVTGVVLTGATVAQIWYEKPSGITGIWTATVSTIKLQYTTDSGDIDESGTWKLQGYVELPSGWKGASSIVSVEVEIRLV